MALFRWRGDGGGTKSDYNDGRNWVDGAGAAYLVGRYPGSTAAQDDVVFDAPLGSGVAPAGYDATALTALKSFKVGKDYDGDIGSSGAYLKVQVSMVGGITRIAGDGGGDYYIEGVGADGLLGVRVDGGNVHFKGKIQNASIRKGTVEYAASSVLGGTLIIGTSGSDTDPVVAIAGGCTMPTVIICYGGVVTCNSAITNDFFVIGGVWSQYGNVTNVDLSGGTFNWYTGDITYANCYSGTFDASVSPTGRTVSTLLAMQLATVNLDNGLNNIVFTNPIKSYGATITYPYGCTLAVGD